MVYPSFGQMITTNVSSYDLTNNADVDEYDIETEFEPNQSDTFEQTWNHLLDGDRVLDTYEYHDLILETFFEIKDYLHSESLLIGDMYWDLDSFMEFITELEICYS